MPDLSTLYPGLRDGYTLPLKSLQGAGMITFGNIWFVSSVSGSDSNVGNSPATAFATLATACSKITASNGDIIFVLPGHTETYSTATAITISKAGARIIGLGYGVMRPTFTLDTATTTTITVTANDVSIENCIFVANFAAVAACFTLTTAKQFTLTSCEFRDTDSSHNFIALVVTGATSNAADGLTIDSCKFFGLAATGAVKLVSMLGTNDRVTIQNNYYSTPTTGAGAVIPIATGKIITNFLLLKNRFNLKNATGTGTGYILTTDGSTNTGFIDGNMDFALPTTPLFCTASSGFVYGANLHTDQADLQGYLVPGADV